VLERLAPAKPYTKPMFGSLAVYVGEKIVFILRRRDSSPVDNGVWVATTEEHHESLRRDFPNLRSIAVFGGGVTGWQVLAEDTDDFESAVESACELVLKGDTRIGKVPGARKKKAAAERKKGLKAVRSAKTKKKKAAPKRKKPSAAKRRSASARARRAK
jgi:hypothetical protein